MPVQPEKTNLELNKEYKALIEALDGDKDSRRATRQYMDNSTAIVHHRHVASSFFPKLYNQQSYELMKYACELTHTILCKVIARYLEDVEYRKIFNYDKRLVDLILTPRNYEALLPFARFDIFLNEESYEFGFCEFNADGSSGMNENREITHSIESSASYKAFSQKHSLQGCELFKSWVDEFLRIYDTYAFKVEHPHVCICDYLENAVVAEFEVFVEEFEKRGVQASICDVRDLRFENNTLYNKQGKEVHAIWRRSVTNDVLEFWDESSALIESVKAQRVALIGSFAGHIVHDKQIFEALFHPLTQEMLTKEEQEFVAKTVPQTQFLDPRIVNIDEIKANKDAWIIKPRDGYGALDVYAGCFNTQEEWMRLVDTFSAGKYLGNFLVQRYITPYKTITLVPDLDIASKTNSEIDLPFELYNNLEGLYCYNGNFQGVFSRLGPYPTISKPLKGITSATIWVDCKLS